MFWSGNYTTVRELNYLLKEENVTLSQVLEAEDILHECKADHKALIQFLTRPDILAEMITLITEEPPNNVKLTSQYRHASIACEVLTSHLSMLSDRLSSDTEQMNRLCDFLNKDPPLNPLLASYFSKTVEMLLERNPKQPRRSMFGYLRSHFQFVSAFSAQDFYLYNIVCLRVIDFFKSRPEFLPNLLRHMSTSAISDVIKCFIRVEDTFSKTIIKWLDEYQFIDSLIQIVCCLYTPEEICPQPTANTGVEHLEKAERENNEKSSVANHRNTEINCKSDHNDTSTESNHTESNNVDQTNHRGDCNNVTVNSVDGTREEVGPPEKTAEELERLRLLRQERMQEVASANAASLLCDIINSVGTWEGSASQVRSRVVCARAAGSLLAGMFTSGRGAALVSGARLLRNMICPPPLNNGAGGPPAGVAAAEPSAGAAASLAAVEAALAPHLPLLHNALYSLHAREIGGVIFPGAVGEARIQVCGLLAALAASVHPDVVHTMLTLGTVGLAVDLFPRYPHCSLLHAEVHQLIRNAFTQEPYIRQLLGEYDILTKLMDLYEENEAKKCSGGPRSAYMGHVILTLRHIAAVWDTLAEPPEPPGCSVPAATRDRWLTFMSEVLQPLASVYDTPLGGCYPADNKYDATKYEFNTMRNAYDGMEGAEAHDIQDIQNIQDIQDMSDVQETADVPEPADHEDFNVKKYFMELASQRFDDYMWGSEPPPPADLVLPAESPWEESGQDSSTSEGWAQFSDFPPPADPFGGEGAGGAGVAGVAGGTGGAEAEGAPDDDQFTPFWSYKGAQDDKCGTSSLEEGVENLAVSDSQRLDAATRKLTNNLLTAMSSMTPAAIANIVNANIPQLTADVDEIRACLREMSQAGASEHTPESGEQSDKQESSGSTEISGNDTAPSENASQPIGNVEEPSGNVAEPSGNDNVCSGNDSGSSGNDVDTGSCSADDSSDR